MWSGFPIVTAVIESSTNHLPIESYESLDLDDNQSYWINLFNEFMTDQMSLHDYLLQSLSMMTQSMLSACEGLLNHHITSLKLSPSPNDRHDTKLNFILRLMETIVQASDNSLPLEMIYQLQRGRLLISAQRYIYEAKSLGAGSLESLIDSCKLVVKETESIARRYPSPTNNLSVWIAYIMIETTLGERSAAMKVSSHAI